jgi:hypothetical protein
MRQRQGKDEVADAPLQPRKPSAAKDGPNPFYVLCVGDAHILNPGQQYRWSVKECCTSW